METCVIFGRRGVEDEARIYRSLLEAREVVHRVFGGDPGRQHSGGPVVYYIAHATDHLDAPALVDRPYQEVRGKEPLT